MEDRIPYIPSPDVVRKFRVLYNGGWLSSLLSWLGGRYLDDVRASEKLTEIVAGSVATLVYTVQYQEPMRVFELFQQKRGSSRRRYYDQIASYW